MFTIDLFKIKGPIKVHPNEIPQPRTLDRDLQLNLILQLTIYLRSELKIFRKWKKDQVYKDECRVPWYRQLAYSKGALPFVIAVSVVQWMDRHWTKLGPRKMPYAASGKRLDMNTATGDNIAYTIDYSRALSLYLHHLLVSGEERANIQYVLEKPWKFQAEIVAHAAQVIEEED